METEDTPIELLEQVDALDRLEKRREDFGPAFVRRHVFVGLFAGTTILSLLPVLLDYTPLEYGLPWFLVSAAGYLGAKSLRALARGLKQRRRLEREIASLLGKVSVERIETESAGGAS